MKLHEFITATLGEIQQGVQNAINNTINGGVAGAINPVWGTAKDIGPTHIQNIQFDVAVTVVEKESGSVKGGIEVIGIRVGGSASGSTENTYASRVQFSIPVIPPVTTISNEPLMASPSIERT